ncbi:MAG: hypothetical protein OWU32_01960 [Firmicutes bacterium]|nr:hypothetical protein [Bacillota bacterium]
MNRFLSYASVALLGCVALSGCGFVDISALRATSVKQSVAVLADRQELSGSLVAGALAAAPRGVLIQTMTYPADAASVAHVLSAGQLDAVVVDAPDVGVLSWARRFPRTRFFVVGQPLPGSPTNVTWLVPDIAEASAAYAGYLAGGLATSPGSVVAAVYGGTFVSATDRTLFAAMASGLHAALSSAVAVPMAASLVRTPVSAVINLSSASGATGDPAAPTISLAHFTPNAVATVSPGELLAEALRLVWHGGFQSVETELPVVLPAPTLQANYRGWPGAAGASAFARALQSGLTSPLAFSAGLPSARELQSLHLPIPGVAAKKRG